MFLTNFNELIISIYLNSSHLLILFQNQIRELLVNEHKTNL